ncbi:MAG: hypothetical protein ACJAZ3_001251 [Sphingobacteriales bacterium]|jgi:uncharacterized protein (TIGR00661 family)
MKILFAVQGTGNGHLSRARDVIPHLKTKGELDVLVSGLHGEIELEYTIKYKFHGVGFFFGKNGGIDLFRTIKSLKLIRFFKDVFSLPVKNYDLIISDFEPVSAWACKIRGKKCIALSHQSAFLSANTPRPKKINRFSEFVLKNYAPVNDAIAVHFKAFDHFIYTPIIRKEVRELEVSNENHYTVYLPAYSDMNLIEVLNQLPDIKWQIFSKHSKDEYEVKNVSISPIQNQKFLESLASCAGFLCGAGFEGPAEAMFLGKKLLVVPMKGQYEQYCNAEGAKTLGAGVLETFNQSKIKEIKNWIATGKTIHVDFPDNAKLLVEKAIRLS